MRSSIFWGSVALALIAACAKKNEQPSAAQVAETVDKTIAPVAIERPTVVTREGSTVALGKLDGKKVAFISDEDTGSVRTIDLVEKREIGSVALGGRPGQIVVTKTGQLAVALRDDASVALLDARANGSLAIAKKTSTAGEPVGVTLAADDATLFVVTGFSHTLQAFRVGDDGAIGERTLDMQVEREPRAVSISADQKRAFVAHAASSKLEVVEIGSGTDAKIASTTDLGIPATSQDSFGGGFGSVGRMRPMMMPPPPMNRALPSRVVFDALIPVADLAATNSSMAFDDCFDCGTSAFQDQVLPARFGRQAYAFAHVIIDTRHGPLETFVVPHTEMMTGDPMIISTGYGGGGFEGDIDEPAERFTLSMLDATTGKRRLFAQAGDARDKEGCHLPRGAATDGTGNVYVSCFGSDELMAFSVAEKSIDVPVVPDPNVKLKFVVDQKGDVKSKSSTTKSYYLAMSYAGRVPVAAGPSGIALDSDEHRVVSFSQLDGTLSIVDTGAFTTKEAPAATTIKLMRSSGLTEQAANGRKLFFSGGDQRIAKDGRACSSCHPDGRDDGLVWSTPDGPRQTIMLAGRVNRPGPYGWLGKHATLQMHMATTMKNLKGTGIDDTQANELAAFLVTLKGPQQKWHALTTEETHGRDLFNSADAQCASCHSEKSGFTDHDTHDIRSATNSDQLLVTANAVPGQPDLPTPRREQIKAFLVPSLVDVGGTAPYFHDGRFATLGDLIDKCDGTMGATKQMSPADKQALAAYLRTL